MNVEVSASSIWRLVSPRATSIVACNVGAGTPFYCIHPVAGDIAVYGKLFELIDKRQSINGIQVPTAKMESIIVRSVAELAQGYADAIGKQQPAGALMLGGYSAGAVIALETAQCLEQNGRDVALVVAIDGAPLNSGMELAPWHPAYVAAFMGNLPRWLLSRRLRDWTPKNLRRRLVDRAVFRGSTPKRRGGSGEAPRQHVATVAGLVGRAGWTPGQLVFIRSLYDALHAYVPRTYAGRVLVVEADINPLKTVPQTGRIWAGLAPNCEQVRVSAHHGNLLNGGAATQTIANHLNRVFADIREKTDGAQPL